MARTAIYVGVGLVASAAAALWSVEWYNIRYTRPAEIQRSMFGRQIVDASSLMSRDGWPQKEGVLTWKYRADRQIPEIFRRCQNQTINTCKFVESRQIDAHVTRYVSYDKGTLTLEEWWN